MFFTDVYSVPANTTTNAPSWRKLTIAKGVIKNWVLYGPDEKADLLHIRIEYHGSQILPFGGQTWMYPFDSSHPITENIDIKDSPYVLDIYAYNEDDANAHEYILGVVIEPAKPVSLSPTLSQTVIEGFRNLFGGV